MTCKPFAWELPGHGIAAAVVAAIVATTVGACSSGADPDFVGPPPVNLPSLTVTGGSIAEGDAGDTTLAFSVTLSAASTSAVTASYSTTDGTASFVSDYDQANGTLTIAAGATSQSIDVTVHGDVLDELDETLTLTLSGPGNATISQATATGTIVDDDDPIAQVFGLDSRPDNLTCVAPARPSADASVSVIDAFPGLPDIVQPTKMLLEPVADPRWFVLRKTGQLVTFDPDSATSVSTYLDLSGVVRTNSEGGLLGMAFHPAYPATPEIFLSYTIDHSGPAMRSVISRFILDNVTTPGPGTVEQVILQVDQDFDNHNGGDIAFGADGFLYIGFGDGGSGGDPNNRAQDTRFLLGSMLRIDVNGPGAIFPGNPYDIPQDNPYSGNADCGPGANADDCPEIFAWGLRNPWRWSFDSASGALWLADVGQGAFEEVDLIELGGNYGWRCREGAHDHNVSGCSSGYIDPVTEYARGDGNSITGGFVYRGSAIPELDGRYIFADYGSGRIWALQTDGQGGYSNDQLIDTSFGPTSFGVDAAGELYFTDINNSRLRMLAPAGPATPDTVATALADTGCVDPVDVRLPYAGLVPYDINAPFWSDGAVKDRHIGLPNGTNITRNAEGDWEFPEGTVIVKNFRLNGILVETRHLMRHPDGVWAGYTYEWDALQTAATRVRGGKSVSIAGREWIFPAEGQCMECHTSSAGFALGPETAQLNKAFTYPSTQRGANQLDTLDHVMMFSSPLPGPSASLAALADPTDAGIGIAERARDYLHTNCAQCHRPGGPTPSDMDLRYGTALPDTNACDATPMEGGLGIGNARLIAPGEAARSVLINRFNRRDSHGMPPLGTSQIDMAGLALLTSWIDGLGGCN